MAPPADLKRRREESEEREPVKAPALRDTVSTWQYPEEVAMMDPKDIFKDIKGLTEARYQQDLYRIFTQNGRGSAQEAMQKKWFKLRSHDLDAIDALCASRYPPKSQFKSSDRSQIVRTVHTMSIMRKVNTSSQSQELVDKLAVLHFDYLMVMCLEGERNNHMAFYEESVPDYMNDFEQLAELLQARQLPRSVQTGLSVAGETFSGDTMEMVDRMKVDPTIVRSSGEIGGYTQAKESLLGAVYLFTDLPHLTELGLHSQGILLHGVTGCGKTSLAMSIAESRRCTVFHMRSSDIVDKWVGATERNVRALFSIAQASQPSVIFIDEVESLFGARRSDASAVEKRLQSELLSAMTKYSHVLVVAATNLPWALDPAFMSRFHQHIHIALPNEQERGEILKVQLKKTLHDLEEQDLATVARSCVGFTGGTIRQMISQQFMASVAKIPAATHFREAFNKGSIVFYPCAEADQGAQRLDLEKIKSQVYPPPLTCRGLMSAVGLEKRNVRMLQQLDDKHASWSKESFQE